MILFHHFHPAHVALTLFFLTLLVVVLAAAVDKDGGNALARVVAILAVVLAVVSLCGCGCAQ